MVSLTNDEKFCNENNMNKNYKSIEYLVFYQYIWNLFYSLMYGNKPKMHLFFLSKFRFSCTNMITYIQMQSYNVPIIVMFPFYVSPYGTD